MTKLNLPNKITLGRLALAVVFFVLVSYDKPALLDVALVVFVAACVTDILDGYLARKYNMVTVLGRIADPFVDKVIVCGAFVLLAGRAPASVPSIVPVAPWMVVVLISREFLVSSIRGYAESRGIAFGSEVAGKVKAIIQMIACGAAIYFVAHGNLPFLPARLSSHLTVSVVYIAVLITVLSAASYIDKAVKVFAAE